MSQQPRPKPAIPPSQSSSMSSTWSRTGTDESQHAGAPGLGTGNNTGLWSLLTAASKYNAFEVEEEDDDSVRCLLFNVPR